jgi:hypothetical protein
VELTTGKDPESVRTAFNSTEEQRRESEEIPAAPSKGGLLTTLLIKIT